MWNLMEGRDLVPNKHGILLRPSCQGRVGKDHGSTATPEGSEYASERRGEIQFGEESRDSRPGERSGRNPKRRTRIDCPQYLQRDYKTTF